MRGNLAIVEVGLHRTLPSVSPQHETFLAITPPAQLYDARCQFSVTSHTQAFLSFVNYGINHALSALSSHYYRIILCNFCRSGKLFMTV
jgi:hypothetical protein